MLLQNIPDEQDAFWCLVYIMFEKNWREIYDKTSCKISLLISDFQSHLKRKNKSVYEHIKLDEGFTYEACITSQIITLFIYDCEFDQATRMFEMFLLDGEQVIVDLLVTFIEKQTNRIMQLTDFELMNYLRKEMITDTLNEYSFQQILPTEPKVKLTPYPLDITPQ